MKAIKFILFFIFSFFVLIAFSVYNSNSKLEPEEIKVIAGNDNLIYQMPAFESDKKINLSYQNSEPILEGDFSYQLLNLEETKRATYLIYSITAQKRDFIFFKLAVFQDKKFIEEFDLGDKIKIISVIFKEKEIIINYNNLSDNNLKKKVFKISDNGFLIPLK